MAHSDPMPVATSRVLLVCRDRSVSLGRVLAQEFVLDRAFCEGMPGVTEVDGGRVHGRGDRDGDVSVSGIASPRSGTCVEVGPRIA
jgi:hypothetical protein